jgi:NTE family protein
MASIRNLVFSGAGVDGAGFVGAARQLEKQLGSLKPIERVGGTSSGSIMALMVALNATAAEIEKLYLEIDFKKVADSNSFIGQTINLIEHNSLYDGDVLRMVIEGLFKKRNYPVNMTFADLAKLKCKDLHVVTSIVYERDGQGTAEPRVFSPERTPNTSIMLAVLASASIPGLFPPIYMREIQSGHYIEDKNGFAHVDGGFTLNFADSLFDKKKYVETQLTASQLEDHSFNPHTLGFLIYTEKQIQDIKDHNPSIKSIPPHKPLAFLKALLYGAVLGSQNYAFRNSKNAQRTVLISDKNISGTNFNITQAEKMQLIESGVEAVREFFDPQKKPIMMPRSPSNYALSSSPIHKRKPVNPLRIEDKAWDNERQDKPKCTIL